MTSIKTVPGQAMSIADAVDAIRPAKNDPLTVGSIAAKAAKVLNVNLCDIIGPFYTPEKILVIHLEIVLDGSQDPGELAKRYQITESYMFNRLRALKKAFETHVHIHEAVLRFHNAFIN